MNNRGLNMNRIYKEIENNNFEYFFEIAKNNNIGFINTNDGGKIKEERELKREILENLPDGVVEKLDQHLTNEELIEAGGDYGLNDDVYNVVMLDDFIDNINKEEHLLIQLMRELRGYVSDYHQFGDVETIEKLYKQALNK